MSETFYEKLEAIAETQDKLVANKVAKFCYTDTAYTENDVNGHSDFVITRDNNIPTPEPSTLKVNETVLLRGWRATASSITRMLLNHFLGRVSYNLNKVNDNVKALLTALEGSLGEANGFASLDENGRIPFSQLPESAIEYQGNWNARTNTPELSNGMEGATSGDFYIVSVGGTHDFGDGTVTFFANDRLIYNKENKWERLPAGSVRSVNNKAPDSVNGNVTLFGTDIKMSETDSESLLSKIVKCVGSTLIGRYWEWAFFDDIPVYSVSYDNTVQTFLGKGVWAVGTQLGVFYSIDGGKSWEQSARGLDMPVTHLCKGGNRLVAVFSPHAEASGYLYYSDDGGQTWTTTDYISGTWISSYLPRSLFYVNGIWYHIPYVGKTAYSTDGIHWQLADAATGMQGLRQAVFVNNRWVGVVWSSNSTVVIKTSTDGITWTEIETQPTVSTTKAALRGGATGIIYANGYWVFWVGTDSSSTNKVSCYYSKDLQTWTASSLTEAKILDIQFANGVFVAISTNGGLWYCCKDDPFLWNNVVTADTRTSGDIRSFCKVCYANGVWVTAGYGFGSPTNGGLRYSTDGINWLSVGKWEADVSDICFGDNTWIAAVKASNRPALFPIGILRSSVETLIDEGWLS